MSELIGDYEKELGKQFSKISPHVSIEIDHGFEGMVIYVLSIADPRGLLAHYNGDAKRYEVRITERIDLLGRFGDRMKYFAQREVIRFITDLISQEQ